MRKEYAKQVLKSALTDLLSEEETTFHNSDANLLYGRAKVRFRPLVKALLKEKDLNIL